MSSLYVLTVFLLAGLTQIQCSIVAPAIAAAPVAYPAVRYSLVAPQNIRPFAAQVSTFTKGLSVYAAPYAAGVIGGPAIVPAPGPIYPGLAPVPGYPPGPLVGPAHVIAPAAPVVGPAPVYPAPIAAPAPLWPGPFARSIHAVAPGAIPAVGPPVPALYH